MSGIGFDVQVKLNELVDLANKITELRTTLKKLDMDAEPKAFREQEKTLRDLRKQYDSLKGDLGSIVPTMQKLYKEMGSTLPIEKSIEVLKTFAKEQSGYLSVMEENFKKTEAAWKNMEAGKRKSDLSKQLNIERSDLEEQRKTVEKATAAYKELEAATKSTGASKNTLRTQILAIRNEMSQLTLSGQQQSARYKELQSELARLGTAYNEVGRQQKLLTTAGNAQIAGLVQGITGLSGAFTAFSGVSSLFIKDQAKMAEVQKNLQAAMSITIGLQQVSQTLHASSSFRIGFVSKATQAWTAAQKALNVQLGLSVALSKGLMAGGIGLLIGGIIALTMYFKKLRKEQEEVNRISKLTKESFAEAAKAANESSVKQTTSLNILYRASQDQTKSLKERMAAVKELQREYPNYFGNMSKEAILAGNATKEYDKLKAAIIAKAKAQAFADEIAKNSLKQFEFEQANVESTEKIIKAQERLAKVEAQMQATRGAMPEESAQFYINQAKAITSGIEEEQKAIESRNKQITEIENIKEELEKKINVEALVTDVTADNSKAYAKLAKQEETALNELNRVRKETARQEVSLTKDEAERARQESLLTYQERISDLEGLERKWLTTFGSLTDEQTNILTAARKMAEAVYKDSLNKISEAETKKNEELIKKYADYNTKRLATIKKFQEDRMRLEAAGAAPEQMAELEYQQTTALESIDQEFAQRQESYLTWSNSITNMALDQLQKMLYQAEQELKRMEFLTPGSDLSVVRAQIAALKDEITKVQDKTNETPGDDSFKRWMKMQKTLRTIGKDFKEIGDIVGGTAGDILNLAGDLSTSVLSMIDGITKLAEDSAKGMVDTAKAGSEAMSSVEKASVILAIISAALKVVTALYSFFTSGSKVHKENLRLLEEQNQALVKAYDLAKLRAQIESESSTTMFGTDAYGKAKDALEAYKDSVKLTGKAVKALGKAEVITGYQKKKTLGITTGSKAIYDKMLKQYPDLKNSEGELNLERAKAILSTADLADASKKLLEDAINYTEAMKEAYDSMNSYFEGVFGDLGATLTTALADAFRNGTDAAQTFTDAVSDMLDQLAEDMFYSLYIAPLLSKAQEQIMDIFQSGVSDATKFSQYADVLKGLTSQASALGDAAEAWFGMVENVKDVAGLSKKVTTEATATTKGISSLTEDTGKALEGRFTALQLAGEETKRQNIEQTSLIESINEYMRDVIDINSGIFTIVDETRTFIVRSYMELQMIQENTAGNWKTLKEVASDIKVIKRNSEKL